jgi:hypothetical protein
MADTIDIPVPHDPTERARQREASVRGRIIEVLAKYNVQLETASLDALTMAVERLIEAGATRKR